MVNRVERAGTHGITHDYLRHGTGVSGHRVGMVKLAIGQDLLLYPRIREGGLELVRADQLRRIFLGLFHRGCSHTSKHPVIKLALGIGFGPPDGEIQARKFARVRIRVGPYLRDEGIALGG